tara:strand:- start:243 stop:1079 length:837 start_codon:yes stop_codon:yes gene_type:complete
MLFRFVAGNNYKHALNIGKNMIRYGNIPIINYINENVNIDNKYKVAEEYKNLLKYIDSSYILALKLSSLNFNRFQAYSIADMCKEKNIKLIIDAEDNENIEKYRNIVNFMIKKYNNNSINIIKTYQMYRKDCMDELNDDIKEFNRSNTILVPKLVRGAYYNTEYNGNHLFKNKKFTDINYNNAILTCFNNNIKQTILASHNKESIELGIQLYNNKNINNNNILTIANLMGMNHNYMKTLNNSNIKKATYIPYGPYKEMIPYLSRRLYENIDQIKYTLT